MKFFYQTNIKIIVSLLLLIFTLNFSWSQCSPPDQLPTNDCSTAPVICLHDGCFTTENNPVNGWNGFCGGGTAIHNPQYFEVIPTDPHVIIVIHVDNCTSGSGLQAAFLAECPWDIGDVLDCDNGSGGCVGCSMILDVDNLVVGQSYWIVIDGNAGAFCQYTITETIGIFAPEIEEELDPLQTEAFPNVVCQGFDELFIVTGPPVANAHGYLWEFEWNGLTWTTTLPELVMDIPNNAPPGFWDICVRGFSGCDTTENEVCVQIEITTLDDIIKDTVAVCPEAFPFSWFSLIISEPGTYTQTFDNPDGCPHDSIWTVESHPGSDVGIIDTVHCGISFFYEGISYDQSGVYEIVYPEGNVFGCDSFTELHLMLEAANLIVEHICINGQQMLSAHVLELLPPNETLFFEWYDCSYTAVLSTNQQLEIDSSGCYCLIYSSSSCTDTICATYSMDPCLLSCDLVAEEACLFDDVLFSYSAMVSPTATYSWVITLPGGEEEFFTGNDSLHFILDSVGCYIASLTIADDSISFTCVDSVCIDTLATASICCDTVMCEDCIDLIFELTGDAPWTIVLTNGTTIDTISGILTSPYAHEVCQPDGSSVYYTLLEVTESGSRCPGEFPGNPMIIVHNPANPVELILFSGDSILCSEPGFYDYAWYACDSTGILSDTVCFVPPASGCYCVDATDQWGCRWTSCTQIILGTDDQNSIDKITLYPNPTKEFLQIHIDGNISFPVQWQVYDITGIQRDGGSMEANDMQLDMTKLCAGLYFISFIDRDQRQIIFKIIRA